MKALVQSGLVVLMLVLDVLVYSSHKEIEELMQLKKEGKFIILKRDAR